jgi:hypothetical protein
LATTDRSVLQDFRNPFGDGTTGLQIARFLAQRLAGETILKAA